MSDKEYLKKIAELRKEALPEGTAIARLLGAVPPYGELRWAGRPFVIGDTERPR